MKKSTGADLQAMFDDIHKQYDIRMIVIKWDRMIWSIKTVGGTLDHPKETMTFSADIYEAATELQHKLAGTEAPPF